MATNPLTDPDPRTSADDDEDATDEGLSSESPAEGGDDEPAENPGSPKG